MNCLIGFTKFIVPRAFRSNDPILGRNYLSPRFSFTLVQSISSGSAIRPSSSERKKLRRLEKQSAIKSGKIEVSIPDFQNLLRQFYKKAHPDLLRAEHAECAAVNDQSFQELNGVLSSLKTPGEFPTSMLKSVHFYLRKPDGTVSLSQLHIRTSGGDCRKSITKSFVALFKDAGVLKDDIFTWNKDYFPDKEEIESRDE